MMTSPLFKAASLYTGANIINSAIPFILMPVLTRYLAPADYGMVSMFGVLVSFAAAFIGVNTDGAIARKYFDRENINFPTYISTCLILLIISTLLVAFVFFIGADFLVQISSVPQQWLWAVIIVCFAQFCSRILLVLWQVSINPKAYGVYQIGQTIVNLVLSLGLVIGAGYGWRGRIMGLVISSAIFALIAIFILWRNKWISQHINKDFFRSILSFGVPLIPHSVGALFITMTDRLFITNMVNIEATGLYVVGYQIGMIIGILQDSFNKAYVPWLYSKLKMNSSIEKIRIVKFTYTYFVIILLLAYIISVVAPPLLNILVGSNYTGSSPFIGWIAFGYAFNGMYKMVVNYIFYANKTFILAWITFTTAIINIGLNYLLISLNGAIGSAQASVLSFVIMFVMTWILSAKVYQMPWKL